ncbi:hypothetical protein [Massilia sp. Leaf139]|nr:hypothetical protein [Massilia sp. Leaf139]
MSRTLVRSLPIASLSIVCLALPAYVAPAVPLRVVMDRNYPPYSFLDA